MLENVKANIEKLISLYETQKQISCELSSRVDQLTAQNAKQAEKIKELSEQLDKARLGGAFTGGGSESKARITKLIEDIDKCIKILEN